MVCRGHPGPSGPASGRVGSARAGRRRERAGGGSAQKPEGAGGETRARVTVLNPRNPSKGSQSRPLLLLTDPFCPQAPGSAPSAVGRECAASSALVQRGPACAFWVRFSRDPTGPTPSALSSRNLNGGQDLAAGSMVDVQLSATLCTLTLNCICFSSIKWT